MSYLIGRLARLGLKTNRARIVNYGFSSIVEAQVFNHTTCSSEPSEDQSNARDSNYDSERNVDSLEKYRISSNIPRKDRATFLAKTLRDLDDNKEAVYGALDAWVAWEENFPIALIRRALNILEKEQEWHRIVQVIKWMLSKGQGTTLQTYGILILALDMDNRADEAHEFWKKRISINLHSVPWQLCRRMIAIYYRNQNFDKIVQLFEELEAFDRKPPEKSIVMRVANAYELLGKLEEKERILEKYNNIITREKSPNKPRKPVSKKKKKQKK